MAFFTKSIDIAALPLDILDEVRGLFKAKGWPIEDPFDDEDSLFEKFAAMFARLTADERNLVLTLTEDFLYCVMYEEDRAVRRTLRAIDQALVGQVGQVISVPLVKAGDIGKMKSGGYANYRFRAEFDTLMAQQKKPCFFYDRAELLQTKHNLRSNTLVMLVDDFLGSGQTAESAINAYRTHLSVASDHLLVVAFVAQQQAIEHVAALGVNSAVGLVRERGISDSSRIEDKASAVAVMRGLSARLGVRSEMHQLGHNGAEALVAMNRCPNNTFPCYWTTKSVDSVRWPAPFKK